MKGIKTVGNTAPVIAVTTALASLACCLPWGTGALLGGIGLALALEQHRSWLIILSLSSLGVGGYSFVRQRQICQRTPKALTVLLVLAAITVLVIAAFPEAVANIMLSLQ
jgi:hypothetical protein